MKREDNCYDSHFSDSMPPGAEMQSLCAFAKCTVFSVGDATATCGTGVLIEAGVDVRNPCCGPDALRLLEQLRPALVLINPSICDAEASELCRRIRSSPEGKHIALVRLFAHPSAPVRPEEPCPGSDADVLLPDSVNPVTLAATLRTLLRAHSAETELAAALERERHALREVADARAQCTRIEEHYRALAEAAEIDHRQLESVINSMNEGLAVFGREGELLMMNPAALRLHGFRDMSEMSARLQDVFNLFEARYPDGSVVPEDQRPTIRALAGEVVTSFEEQLVRRDTGQSFVAEYSAAPVRNLAGGVERAVVTIRDVTKLKAAERDLRESEERLRLAQVTAHVGVWDWRAQTGEQTFTPELERLYGCAPGTFKTYADWRRRVHPDDIAGIEAEREEALAARRPFDLEFRILHASGEVRWLSAKGAAMYDDAGNIVRVLGVNIDITERKQSEQALRQAQKLESIGVLAGGVAHDFNNLLTTILGNASLAAMEGQVRIGDRLQAIVDSAEKAAALTCQLLAYAGKGQFQIGDIDISRLVRSSADLIRVSIPKNVDLVLDIPEDLPAIRGDAAQIHQVVMNLVINAAEAIGDRKNGRVSIRAGIADPDGNPLRGGSTADSCLFISVRDNGCGMEEQVKTRIFDPFFTTKFTGRGLGLAAVQGILRAHKGTISVESTPGEGTCFTVYLPAGARGAFLRGQQTIESAEHPAATILVVDDEPQIRALTQAVLERLGHTVLLAEHGGQALELLAARTRVDLVVLDLIMPVTGGADAFSELRARWPAVGVVVSSGYSQEEAHRLGIPDDVPFLKKPYTAQELASEVARVLANR